MTSLPAYEPARATHIPTLSGLPVHVLLNILAHCSLDRFIALRATCKSLYTLSMFYLRRLMLPAYLAKIRGSSSTGLSEHVLDVDADGASVARELKVLDLFCLACAYEAKRLTESELFADTSDAQGVERDLFELKQPRARLEDLVLQELSRRALERPQAASLFDGLLKAPENLSVALTAQSAKLNLLSPSPNRPGSLIPRPYAITERVPGQSLHDLAAELVSQLVSALYR